MALIFTASAQVTRSHDNICKQLHMPAQSGSSRVLGKMRRGYSREAYDALIDRVRSMMPKVQCFWPPVGIMRSDGFAWWFCSSPASSPHISTFVGSLGQIALSTDMICGFCGETEDDHIATLDLLSSVGYDQAFIFAYSLRDKTYAARHLQVCGLATPSAKDL